jgi:predicted HTH domain antitoxin
MKVTIEIPGTIEQSVCDQLGQDLEKAAKESLAIAWYQSEKISIGQVAEMLNLSVYEAEGFMKERNIPAPYLEQDYEADQATLDRLLKS